jgi:phenylacetate-CoA ligase
MTSLIQFDPLSSYRSLRVRSSRSVRLQVADGARSLYAKAYESMLYPAWQGLLRGRPIGAQRHILEETQWMSREERDVLQLASLRALLEHAGRNVPYWRELFGKVGFWPREVRSAADLAELPVLTREIIHDRFADLVDPEHRGTNITKGTSGTSGVPLKFEHCNESEAWRQAVRLRGYSWAGYQMGMPTIHYWGAGVVAAPSGLPGQKVRLDRALRREVYIDAARQDEASMSRTADLIARMRPHAIIAYTQALASFARWVAEQGRRDLPDVNVICCAEALMPHDRSALERVFGPEIYETYGSRETMLMGAECELHEGLHMSEENVLLEVVRDGKPVTPGSTGDVVVTDLHNYGMPFIRYANGDLATEDDEPCFCGRTLRKLARVEGRRMDTLHDAHGNPVPGIVFASLLQSDAGSLRAFQVVQKVNGDIELKVVRGRDWNEGRFAGAADRIRAYFKGLPLRVTYCEEIPAAKSGKRRPIVVETNGAARPGPTAEG